MFAHAVGHSPAQEYGIDSWGSDVVADVAVGLVAHASQDAADLDEFILLRLVCVVSLYWTCICLGLEKFYLCFCSALWKYARHNHVWWWIRSGEFLGSLHGRSVLHEGPPSYG